MKKKKLEEGFVFTGSPSKAFFIYSYNRLLFAIYKARVLFLLDVAKNYAERGKKVLAKYHRLYLLFND